MSEILFYEAKKTSGFRKKVEGLTTETLPQIIDDISKMNIGRYIEEAAIGLSQAKLERRTTSSQV